MRMHTHGKCSPNIILGALTVFCVIVLYNYWTLSTFNRELVLKEHNLEQQVISLSKTNDALQANLEKVEEIKDKVENNLKREILVDQKAKEEITSKDSKIKSLQNDLENSKQAAQNCRDDLASSDSKFQKKDKQIAELKASVTSLEAQLVEKNNKLSRIEKDLKDAQKKLADGWNKTITSKSTPAKAPPIVDTAAQPVDQGALAVEVDPAAPYPKGWMDHAGDWLKPSSKIHVSVKNEGDRGILSHGSPVLIFDDPKLRRAKARFSVLDRPKNEMRPDAGAKQIEGLPKPQAQGDPNNGGEDFAGDGGVLPVPGAHDTGDDKKGHNNINRRNGDGAPNLDAAEDDRDGPLKEDLGVQDDQSPDGDLPQKEANGVIQAPESMKNQNERLAAAAEVEQQRHDPFDNHL